MHKAWRRPCAISMPPLPRGLCAVDAPTHEPRASLGYFRKPMDNHGTAATMTSPTAIDTR
ncbi:hypothetical protein BOFL111202_23220 [Bordetella flabilis]